MADKKSNQPAKINDISSPKASPSGRPIITNNGPKNDDPMLSTDSAENPQADMAVSKHKTVIQPLSETDDARLPEQKDDQPEAVEPVETSAETTKDEAETPAPAEPEPEADSEPDTDQAADSSDSIDEADQPASDDGSEDSDESKPDNKDNKAKDEAAKQAAEQERRDKYESMVASGKYALPIRQAGSRTWLVILVVVLIIIAVAVALDLLLDANILKIDNFSPPTNLFN